MPQLTATRHGYEVLEVFPQSPGSQFVARVRDGHGEELVLKRSRDDADAFRHEAQTLRAWKHTGAAVQLIDEPEPGVLALQCLEGETLKHLPDHGAHRAKDIGALARRLHIPAPARTRSMAEHLDHDWQWLLRAHPLIDPDLKDIADRCRRALSEPLSDPVLLHGDFWSSNIMRLHATDELVAIDPYGVAGPATFDLACFASISTLADRRRVLAELAEGHGGPLPLLAEAFAWAVVINFAYLLKRQLPFDGLHLLAAQLRKLGDPEAFLAASES